MTMACSHQWSLQLVALSCRDEATDRPTDRNRVCFYVHQTVNLNAVALPPEVEMCVCVCVCVCVFVFAANGVVDR